MKKNSITVLLLLLISFVNLHSQDQWGSNLELIGIPLQNSVPYGEVIDDFVVGVDGLGVVVWSLEDPENPEHHYRLPLPGTQWNCYRHEELLYINSEWADIHFVDIVDIDDPAEPVLVNHFELTDFPDVPHPAVFPHGEFLYLTTGRNHDEPIYRFSLEDPENPDLTEWSEDGIGIVSLKDGDLLVTERNDEDDRRRYYLIIMGEDGPESINMIAENRSFQRVSIIDEIFINDILLVDEGNDLIVFDISDPENIEEITIMEGVAGYHQSYEIPYVLRDKLSTDVGDYTFVGKVGGGTLIDFTDPEDPEIIQEFECDEWYCMFPSFQAGDLLYMIIAEHHFNQFNDSLWVQVLDVSDPDDIVINNEIPLMSSSPSSPHYDEGMVYFTNNAHYFHGYELTENGDLELRLIYGGDEEHERLTNISGIVRNGIGFIQAFSNNFKTFEFTDPENPELLWEYANGRLYPITLDDSRLFAAGGDGNAYLFDVADPENPEIITEGSFNDIRYRYVVAGDSVYFNRTNGGVLQALQLTDDGLEVLFDSDYIRDGNANDMVGYDSLLITSDYAQRPLPLDWRLKIFYPDLENENFRRIGETHWPIQESVPYNSRLAVRDDGLLAVQSRHRIVIFDVTNAYQPRALANYITPDRSTRGVAWAGDFLISAGSHNVSVLHPIILREDAIVLTPDTLDFGLTQVNLPVISSFILSLSEDQGMARINEWGFDGDTAVFSGAFGFEGWITAEDTISKNVSFMPPEEGNYQARIWYSTDEDTIEVVVIGEASLSVHNKDGIQPVEFAINSLYPNPFNSTLHIEYALPQAGEVSLKLFDLNGREVLAIDDGMKEIGTHATVLDAVNLPTSVYYISLYTPNRETFQKVVLLK